MKIITICRSLIFVVVAMVSICGAAPPPEHTGVFINRRELTRQQVVALQMTYHYAAVPGRYWYDPVSGAWGLDGHEAVGFLMPGHNFGPMPGDASHGSTGVYINGREINLIEALRVRQTFGAVYRGRWWLDGKTGYFGVEGNPVPVGDLVAMLRSRQNARGGDAFRCSVTSCGNDNGQSGYVSVNGITVGYDH
jgi:hypothetical protein